MTPYRRVNEPGKCSRKGTYKLGGHCLVCGFDISPYAGMEVGNGFIVHSYPIKGGCYSEYAKADQSVRGWWETLPAKHSSSFGDHACYNFVTLSPPYHEPEDDKMMLKKKLICEVLQFSETGGVQAMDDGTQYLVKFDSDENEKDCLNPCTSEEGR